jgi:hypothetical protein
MHIHGVWLKSEARHTASFMDLLHSIKKPTHALTSKTLFYIHTKTLKLDKNVL